MKYITRKSLLYKTGVEYGDYTINHIEGCAHGCNYPCYAMLLSKRFGRIKSYKDWLEPKLVSNSIELLNKEIPKLKNKINSVHLCFMSDPFLMGYPEISKMSLDIIKKLNGFGIPVTTLTKGKYPDNMLKYGINPDNEYGVSLVSCSSDFVKEYEPFSQRWHLRIRNLKKLHMQGVKTWVSIEPYPTPNIINQNLSELLERISFVDKIIFGRLNYNSLATKYSHHLQFYNECSLEVTEFCQKNGIKCHIKKGTYIKPVLGIKKTAIVKSRKFRLE